MERIYERIAKKCKKLRINSSAPDEECIFVNLLLQNPHIQHLCIANNCCTPIWLCPTIQILDQTSVTKLTLWGVTMNDESVSTLSQYISNTDNLKFFNMQLTILFDNQFDILANALQENTSIDKICTSARLFHDENDNPMPLCSLYNVKLLEMLQNKKLKYLKLMNYGIDETNVEYLQNICAESIKFVYCDIDCEFMGNIIKNNKNIKKLSIYECRFEGKVVDNLLKSIENNENITNLDFSRNNYHIQYYKAIRSIIENNKNITKYQFYCAMDKNCLMEVALGMQSNNIVTKLSINQNRTDNEILKILMTSPSPIKKLALDLAGDMDESTRHIISRLQYDENMKILNIDGRFGPSLECIQNLFGVLKCNNTLEELKLSQFLEMVNAISAIADYIKVNTQLKKLIIDDTGIENENLDEIYSALEINCVLEYIKLHDKNKNIKKRLSEFVTPEARQHKYDRLFYKKSAKI